MMSVDIELRKAAALIHGGKREAAEVLLTEYLRDFPDSDMAWLLLSYATSDHRKQRAAASRAYRLNPQNERVKERLEQLAKRTTVPPRDSTRTMEGRAQAYITPRMGEGRESVSQVDAPPEEYSPGDYPTQSFYTDKILEEERRLHGPEGKQSLDLRLLVAGGISIIALLVIAVIVIVLLKGYSRSRTVAQATAESEQVAAAATKEARGVLPPTWTPTIEPTKTQTPVPSSTPTPTVTATFVPPNPTIVAEMGIVQMQVSQLRGLSIQTRVQTYLISRSKVRPLLEGYISSNVESPTELIDSGRVLLALGLVNPSYDMMTDVLNQLSDSIGGFYLYKEDQIFVIGVRLTGVEKFIYSHEFDHALVDLNFNVGESLMYPQCAGNEDRCRAIQALVEGDATLLMTQWLEQSADAMDYRDILRYHPPSQTFQEQDPPPYALRDGEFPYVEGLTFVQVLHSRGGWSEVDRAYQELPGSTEQILHPEKYLAREAPIEVTPVSLEDVLESGWRLIEDNTLGEWATFLILSYGIDVAAQVEESVAYDAAQGWGGDHYQVYYNDESDAFLLTVHWIWDSQDEADEFAAAMRIYLEGRSPGGEVERFAGECWEGSDHVTCFYKTGQETLWLVAPDFDILQAIQELYPVFN
jgi:hypothetical protein